MQHQLEKLLTSIKENKKVANDLYNSEHYSWSLFIWHLIVEKTIKAYLISQNKEVPYIHDIRKLVDYSEIKLTDLNISELVLDEITTFNLEARYEDYKFEFYKKATKEYADKWIFDCEKIHNFIFNKIDG